LNEEGDHTIKEVSSDEKRELLSHFFPDFRITFESSSEEAYKK
jgi:hypothetical protein